MTDSVIFSPVETELRKYLLNVLPTPVFINLPEDLPDSFVQVQLSGGAGTVSGVAARSLVTFLCTAHTRAKAAALAEVLRAELQVLSRLGNQPVYRVEITGGPFYNPDPDTRAHRYQLVAETLVRGKRYNPTR